jgi:hypothetical protein
MLGFLFLGHIVRRFLHINPLNVLKCRGDEEGKQMHKYSGYLGQHFTLQQVVDFSCFLNNSSSLLTTD